MNGAKLLLWLHWHCYLKSLKLKRIHPSGVTETGNKLYLVRHSETDLNQKQVYYGWTNTPLNYEGKRQCELLHKKLIDISFDTVISSPLSRAIDSARLITGAAPEAIIRCEGLREFNFGEWEGRHYQEVAEKCPDEWAQWCNDWQNYCIPGGESFYIFYQRVKKEFETILKIYNDKERILIISHQGTLRVIAGLLLRMNPEDLWRLDFDFGSYTMFEFNRDIPVLRKMNS